MAQAVRYYPQLDGVRGLAVLMVVIYHAPSIAGSAFIFKLYLLKNALRLGPLGVDIFFVLSGFLITGILIRSRDTPAFSAGCAFYAKRALRIFPAYFLCLMYCIIFLKLDRTEAWFSVFFLENYHLISTNGAISAFSHTWSVSIEEQFYLVWPLLIRLLPPAWGMLVTGLVIPAIAIAIAILLVSILAGPAAQWSIFAASPVRMLSLSLGGFLAYRESAGKPLSLTRALSAFAIGIVVLAGTRVVQSQVLDLGEYYYLLGIIGFAMVSLGCVAVSLSPGGGTARRVREALAFPPLRYFGKVSFGLYLYHYVVFWSLGMTFGDGPAIDHQVSIARMALAIGLTGGATIGSYYLVEQPALRLKIILAPAGAAWLRFFTHHSHTRAAPRHSDATPQVPALATNLKRFRVGRV